MLKHMHYKKEYVFPFCFSLLLNFLTVNMGSFSLLKRRKNLKDYKVEVGQRGSWPCCVLDVSLNTGLSKV